MNFGIFDMRCGGEVFLSCIRFRFRFPVPIPAPVLPGFVSDIEIYHAMLVVYTFTAMRVLCFLFAVFLSAAPKLCLTSLVFTDSHFCRLLPSQSAISNPCFYLSR